MLEEIASLLLGVVVGVLAACIFIMLFSLYDEGKKIISGLWRLLVYFGGSGGIPLLIPYLVNPQLSIYISYYIIGLTITFLCCAFFFVIIRGIMR